MNNKISYYPGCNMKTSSQALEEAAIATSHKLGFELEEMEKWYCCGTVFSLTRDDLIHQLAPIRNLIKIQESGQNKVVTLCDMCYNTLKRANLKVKDNPDELEKINYFLDREEDYQGEVEIYHLLQILRDQIGFQNIGDQVTLPLSGLKILPYYGCALLRPREVAIDDAEEPKVLSDLVQALGATPVDDRYKIQCCGSYHTAGERKDLVISRAYKILSSAVQKGAEMVVLSCPLCMFNLDDRQKQVLEAHPEFRTIPVLGFTQLMGLALGIEEDKLGFEDNYIDPRPLLKSKDLL